LHTGVGDLSRSGRGQGRRPRLHYIGKLDDSTVFDQSHDRADGLNVILGAGGVIEGIAQGA
jgi:FKBP-type peptidyl-prolyl cis-trans isomerase